MQRKDAKKSKKLWNKFKIVVTLHKAGNKRFRADPVHGLKCQTLGVCFSQYMIYVHIS